MTTHTFNPEKHRGSMCTDMDWNEYLREMGLEADIIPEEPEPTTPAEPDLTAE